MLSDLDPLLRARGIDAAIVPLHEAMHPAFRWITRGAKVTRGYAVKMHGRPPVLIAYPMERDEAAATGVATRLVHDEFDDDRIFKSAPNPVEAYSQFFDRVLHDLGSGKIIVFLGNLPFHLYHGIAEAMERMGWQIHRGGGEDLIQLARKRKEPWEIESIAAVGARTEAVVERVRRVLRQSIVEGDHVLHNGEVLTLGYLKDVVSHEIARLGMSEDHETILSQGRDAAIPHSRGNPAAVVRPSVPIVLDIFPLDRDNGYFFDLTRTFCIGPIPDALQRIHRDVLNAFELAAEKMHAGTPAETMNDEHQSPAGSSFIVHRSSFIVHRSSFIVHRSVGWPSFALTPANHDLVEVGDVLTIEPGLYFPDLEIGVRIEDTLVVREDGRVETLCRSDRGLTP